MVYRILFLGLLLATTSSSAAAQRPPTLPRKANLMPEFQKRKLVPRAQGERDVCSLFAITAVAEFEWNRNSRQPRQPFSEEFLIWAANEASGLKGDQAMFYKAVHGLNSLGICSDKLMPYDNKPGVQRKPSARALADAKGRAGRWKVEWIKRWDVKRPLEEQALLAIKRALAGGHPVACGLRWPKALKGHELLRVPAADDVRDGHSIVFTGYQDDPKKPGGGILLFRNSFGPRWGNSGYGVMSYAYAQTYANDALSLKLGPPNSEVPVERFEAETLVVLARDRCSTNVQEMGNWGGKMWSQGKQLFCAAREGGFVELGFAIGKAGRYRLRVLATAAPDFGKIQASLDGKKLDAEFDLYSGRVSPSGSLELGTYDLKAGKHRLRFTVAGKNAVSDGYSFGLDAIDLLLAK
jgi:hypothetical protein